MKNRISYGLIYSFFLLFGIVFFTLYLVVGEEYKLKLNGNSESSEKSSNLQQNVKQEIKNIVPEIVEEKNTQDEAGVKVIDNDVKSTGLQEAVLSVFDKRASGLEGAVLSVYDKRDIQNPSGLKGSVLSVFDERGRLISDSDDTVQTKSNDTLSGTLSVMWGDDIALQEEPLIQYILLKDSGESVYLDFSDEVIDTYGDPSLLQGERIRVKGDTHTGTFLSTEGEESVMEVSSFSAVTEVPMQEDRPMYQEPLTGSQSWYALPCKFADKPQEPTDPSYFETIMRNEYPYLDDYWREVSYGKINLEGSGAASQWYTMPENRSEYFYDWGVPWLNTSKLMQDCLDAYTGDADFAQIEGIHFMINYNIGGSAWGGKFAIDSDGDGSRDKYVGITILDPFFYHDMGFVAHEMGHGFGLHHSYGGGSVPQYQSRWDVMSHADEIHTISYHKFHLGWIDRNEAFVSVMNSKQTITVERLAKPYREENTYLMAIIPFKDSEFEYYTIELRYRYGYDSNGLPAEGFVIHHVVDHTNAEEYAEVVDEDGDGDVNDEGGVWIGGETFEDPVNDIKIHIINTGPPTGREEVKSLDIEIIRGDISDLAVTVSDSPDPTLVSSETTYSVVVTNLGPDNASNVVAVSEFPQDVELIAMPDYCTESADTQARYVTCNLELVMGPQTVDSIRATIMEMERSPFDSDLDVYQDDSINSLDYAKSLSQYQKSMSSGSIIPVSESLEYNLFPIDIITSGQKILYNLHVRSDVERVISHTISVASDQIDPDITNNTVTEETTFVPISDIMPTMISPKDGDTMEIDARYVFKVDPLLGATEYEFKLFQDDVWVNDSNYTTPNTEFVLNPEDGVHEKLHVGQLVVKIRARLADNWSQERVITINLVEQILSAPVWIQPTEKTTIAMNGCYILKVEPYLQKAGYLFAVYQGGIMVYENWRDAGQLSTDGTQYVFFHGNDYRDGVIEIRARALLGDDWTSDAVTYAILSSSIAPVCR